MTPTLADILVLLLLSIPPLLANLGGFSRPMFAEPITNVTVAVGREAALACVVENLGNHRVAWVHLDRQMIVTVHRQVVTRIPRFSVSHDHQRTWLLHIRGAQPEDAGRYMCQVNSDPMVSQVGYVHVVVPPSILDTGSSPSQLSVRENVRVSLTCRGHGVPAPRVTWKREDGRPLIDGKASNDPAQPFSKHVISQDGEELSFPKVSRTDSGAYLCIATNGVPPSVSKRITLDVEFEPMMFVPNQLLGAPLGSTVTLECVTEAQPRPITYWLRTDAANGNGVMLLASKNLKPVTHYNGYQTHMSLEIQRLELQDIGNYKCVSKNSLGEAEGSIRIYEVVMTQPPTKHAETRATSAEAANPTVEMTNDGHQGNGPGRKADHHQANNQVQQTHLRQETVYTEHPRPPSRSHKDADGGGGTGRRSDTKQSDTGNLRSTNQGRQLTSRAQNIWICSTLLYLVISLLSR